MNDLKLRLCPGPVGRCFYCNEPYEFDDLTIDHFIPVSKGGRRGLLNAVLACVACNAAKADADPRGMGLLFATPVGAQQARALVDLKTLVLMRRAALVRKRATMGPADPALAHQRTLEPDRRTGMTHAYRGPAFDCFHMDDGDNGRVLRSVGAAWPTPDGAGFALVLNCVPLNGRLLLLPHGSAPDAEDRGPGER